MVQHRLLRVAAVGHLRQSGADRHRGPAARHRQLRLLAVQEYENHGASGTAIPDGVFQYLQPGAIRPSGRNAWECAVRRSEFAVEYAAPDSVRLAPELLTSLGGLPGTPA